MPSNVYGFINPPLKTRVCYKAANLYLDTSEIK
jgi:hypothetical protein